MDGKLPFLLTTVLTVIVSGCANDLDSSVRPLQSALGGKYETYQPPAGALAVPSDTPESVEPNSVITLPQALSLALMHNPELAAFSWEIRAAEARALQAGLWPNPEVGAAIENVGGTNEVSGLDGPATTVQLGQLIELSDKRTKRHRVALLQGALAGWDYEAKRLDVLRQVAQAYIELLAAQRGVELASDLVRLSEQTYATVAERVEAGKDPPVERTKAQVAVANAGIELKKVVQRLEAARKELAATWGGKQPAFGKAAGDIEEVDPVPEEDALVALLPQNPAIARWETELEERRAVVDLEKARAVPDPAVLGGYRSFNDTGDSAFVFGLAIPLPITNRNQGAIQESKYNLSKAYKQSQAAEAATYAAFAGAYETLSAACAEVMDIRNVVLPGAQSAFEATRQGYEQGKFDFLAVLDSQRTFFDARLRYLDALASYQKAKAAVESLIGQDLDTAKNTLQTKTRQGE